MSPEKIQSISKHCQRLGKQCTMVSMHKYVIIAILGCVGIVGIYLLAPRTQPEQNQPTLVAETASAPVEPALIIKKIEIIGGATYGVLMRDAGVPNQTTQAILEAAHGVYDLAKIRVGRTLELTYDPTGTTLQRLVYQVDTEQELIVVHSTDTNWQATLSPIVYDVTIATSSGTISSSMYQAALDAGIDERAIIDLADVFQWSVDFALDVRSGDTFSFVYEQRYRNGDYIMPGKILAGTYINAGTPYHVFYFEESDDNKGYFDQDGNSVQKLFLKAPVAYKYITSGYTTGLRYVEAFNVSTGHRAIDYAAALGTPVRSVGDGTVVTAGWNGSYGNFISIRHNGTYTTNYAHLSKINVRRGQKVSQGQTIGAVGSTGFSTGPHLHYEMVKNGVKINPLAEVLPPGQKIKDENMNRFYEAIRPHAQQLGMTLTNTTTPTTQN